MLKTTVEIKIKIVKSVGQILIKKYIFTVKILILARYSNSFTVINRRSPLPTITDRPPSLPSVIERYKTFCNVR